MYKLKNDARTVYVVHEALSYEEVKKNGLDVAYAIRNYMMPILPVKVLRKDWKRVRFSDYYLHNNKKLYTMETKIAKGDDETYFYMFNTRTEKYLIPLSHARFPFKLNSITKYIYANIPLMEIRKKNEREYVDSIRDRYIDRAILIWIKNMVTGTKHTTLYNNIYKDILEEFEVLVKRRKYTNMNLVACVIDKKNSRIRMTEQQFTDVLKRNYFEKTCLVFMINQRGEIVEEYTEYEENSVKGVVHYDILGKDIAKFLDLCSSNTEKENQDYIAIAILRNGDILLVDTGRIEMIKRNGKWHNVHYPYFRFALKNALENLPEMIIRQLYFNVLKANIEYRNMAIAIVHPEDARDYMSLLKSKNTLNIEETKIQKMTAEDQFNTLSSANLISITEEGRIISRNSFHDFNIKGEEDLLRALSNYALIIRVKKDYNIQMFERTNLIYSTK